jgi:hypothetical protein
MAIKLSTQTAKTRAIPHRDRLCFKIDNPNGAETQPPHIAGPLAATSLQLCDYFIFKANKLRINTPEND